MEYKCFIINIFLTFFVIYVSFEPFCFFSSSITFTTGVPVKTKTIHAIVIFTMLLALVSYTACAEGFSFHADAGMATMPNSDIWNTGITLRGTGFNTILENHPNLRLGLGLGISWFGLNEDELLAEYGSLVGEASGHAFIMEIGPTLRYETEKKSGFDYFGEIGLGYTKIWGSTTVDASYSGWSFDATDDFDWDDTGLSIGGGIILWNKLEIKPEYHMILDTDDSDYFTLTAGLVFGK